MSVEFCLHVELQLVWSWQLKFQGSSQLMPTITIWNFLLCALVCLVEYKNLSYFIALFDLTFLFVFV